jgi:hypothetical protein
MGSNGKGKSLDNKYRGVSVRTVPSLLLLTDCVMEHELLGKSG